MDKQTKQFVDPKSNFIDYTLGDVMKPGDTNKFDWFAVVVLGWNLTIRETSSPAGLLNMKKRQLIKIGYKPIFVCLMGPNFVCINNSFISRLSGTNIII